MAFQEFVNELSIYVSIEFSLTSIPLNKIHAKANSPLSSMKNTSISKEIEKSEQTQKHKMILVGKLFRKKKVHR